MKAILFLLCLLAFSEARMIVKPTEKMEANDIVEFIKGLMEGINENGDINKLMECLKGAEEVINDIIAALELIGTGKVDNIIIGITKLVTSVKKLIEMFKPCSDGFKQFQALFDALKHINIQKLVFKVITNLDKIIPLVKNCINDFKNKKLHDAGKCLGNLLLILFLSNTPALGADIGRILATIQAFFDGLNTGNHLNNLDLCISKFPPVIESIKIILASLDWTDLKNIIKSLNSIFDICDNLLHAIDPCLKIVGDFQRIFKIIKSITAAKFMNKLLLNFANILGEITLMTQYIAAGEYEKASFEVGSLVYELLLAGEAAQLLNPMDTI